MMLTLKVKPRDSKSSTETLRKQGFVPAVLYGPKEDAASIAIDARNLESVWKEAGETTIVKLTGAGADKDSLIHDVQVHPVSGKVLHADFYILEKGKKVEIAVPLEFIGEAPAEKLGHILVKALHEIEIEVAPQELPHHLDVDLSGLVNVGDRITAEDIKLPSSATLKTNPEEIVASVTEFVEFKEEAIPTEAAPASEVSTEEAPPEGAASEAKSE
ncbi:MAG TPA: 50S ribosomal protein L25 [Candidatus Paceibacterota bacterium]|nr:50S ribosomal protein L25 [Candidatus Paceibacterota bacterium]